MSREQLAGWDLRFFGYEETGCRNELQLDGYKQRIQEEIQEAIEREAVIEEKEAKPDLDATEWPPEDDFDPYRDALWDTYPRI